MLTDTRLSLDSAEQAAWMLNAYHNAMQKRFNEEKNKFKIESQDLDCFESIQNYPKYEDLDHEQRKHSPSLKTRIDEAITIFHEIENPDADTMATLDKADQNHIKGQLKLIEKYQVSEKRQKQVISEMDDVMTKYKKDSRYMDKRWPEDDYYLVTEEFDTNEDEEIENITTYHEELKEELTDIVNEFESIVTAINKNLSELVLKNLESKTKKRIDNAMQATTRTVCDLMETGLSINNIKIGTISHHLAYDELYKGTDGLTDLSAYDIIHTEAITIPSTTITAKGVKLPLSYIPNKPVNEDEINIVIYDDNKQDLKIYPDGYYGESKGETPKFESDAVIAITTEAENIKYNAVDKLMSWIDLENKNPAKEQVRANQNQEYIEQEEETEQGISR